MPLKSFGCLEINFSETLIFPICKFSSRGTKKVPTPNTKENATEADCKLSIDQAALVILSRSDQIVQKTCSNIISIDLSLFLIVVTVAVLLIFLFK